MIFQHQNLSVLLTRNALTTLHVYKKNVKIHAMPIHVAKMPNVRLKIIEPYVSVFQDLSEILIHFVKNVRLILYQSFEKFVIKLE